MIRIGQILLSVSLLLLVACGGGRGPVALGVAGGGGGNEPPLKPPSGEPPANARQAWEQPVPKASCGPDDRTETALQGQVPLVDRFSGRSLEGYNCNLELVGQSAGEGASWQMAWYDDCIYYDTAKTTGINTNNTAPRANQQHPGVAVVDVSDSSNPQPTAYLDTEAMLDPWESLKAHEARGLLAAVDGAGSGGSAYFDVYDVAGDCTQPELLVSEPVGDSVGHAGVFSHDGLTYYGSDTGNGTRAIDITDPANASLILDGFPRSTHDLSVSRDGTRLYNAVVGLGGETPVNGLTILDVTDIQNRVPDPQVGVIVDYYWRDGAAAQMTQSIWIGGHPYLLFVDEGVSGATGAGFCDQGLPPFAFARIIDIEDETNPFVVGKLMLEVHDPANCEMTLQDEPGLFNYDSHYCTVDDIDNTQFVACSQFKSGLRIFDVRDPYLPREIAYYNPPAKPGYQAGSNYNSTGQCGTGDWTTAHPRWRLDRNEIWITSQCNGFQALRFTRPFADIAGPAP